MGKSPSSVQSKGWAVVVAAVVVVVVVVASVVVVVGSVVVVVARVVVVAKQDTDDADAQRKVIGSKRVGPGQTPG